MKQPLIFLAILFAAFSVFSAEYYVDASRPDDTGAATSWATAKQTIQAAVNLTVDGDTIWVTNGTYARIVVTNAISIHSVNGAHETRVNGGGARGVKLFSGALFDGFSVTNGYAHGGSSWNDGCGGGVFCDSPSTNTVIKNCLIMGNRAANNAAGVDGGYLVDCVITGNASDNTGGGVSRAILSGCTVSGNQSSWIGGGVYCCQATGCLISNNYSAGCGAGGADESTLNRCVVIGNKADTAGGGASESTLNNCLVVGNQAETGGGVFKSTLVNCTVTKNIVTNSYGDAAGGGACFAILRNSIVFNNSADTNADYFCIGGDEEWGFDARYSCFSEATNGFHGNINSNPKFVDGLSGDYRLKPSSSCVNAGLNEDVVGSFDLNGNSRIKNLYADMGAYESDYNSPKQYIRDFLPTNGTVFSVGDIISVSAVGGGSENPVTYALLPQSPVTVINPTTGRVSGGGDIYIVANQAGDSYYDAADPVTNHYMVPYVGTFYVDASRPHDRGVATSWMTAKRTIQAAVNLAADGSVVWVTNGVYNLSSEILVTNTITVQSANGRDVTIVDAGDSNRCFNLSDDCLISGFTITNGVAVRRGGGVCCADSNPTVSNCIITGNRVVGYEVSDGGGMNSGTAIDCIFNDNIAGGGGGMRGGIASNCVFNGNLAEGTAPLLGTVGSSSGGGMSDGTAYNCTFTSNSANWTGGGMEGGTARNCTFNKNTATYAGGGASLTETYNGLFVSNSATVGGGLSGANAYNCTFVRNVAENGGGLSGATWKEEPTEIYNGIFFQNTNHSYEGPHDFSYALAYNSCSMQLIHGVNGNITNAPLFVDAANGDFRLMSNSPCINWGNNSVISNATDLDGNPRIAESVVDMGAYEYQGVLGLTDSDGDGIPDDWERQHGGNQNPEQICSNGVNQVRQAYIAGLDPNDPDSEFLTTVLPGSILRWTPCVSGRVYTVQWSTNLLDGFQPLKTNIPWTVNSFTDRVHNAYGQLFYKIDVQLDE